jgi:hypothetical protein
MREFLKIFSESINFFSQPGYMNYINKNQKIKIVAMEEKNFNLLVSMELMFAYSGRYKYYDQLLKNEGSDKYIISMVFSGEKKDKVDVFRVSEINDPELKDRMFLLDQGYPLVHTCNNGSYVYSYLSEVKEFSESVGDSVREQLKSR